MHATRNLEHECQLTRVRALVVGCYPVNSVKWVDVNNGCYRGRAKMRTIWKIGSLSKRVAGLKAHDAAVPFRRLLELISHHGRAREKRLEPTCSRDEAANALYALSSRAPSSPPGLATSTPAAVRLASPRTAPLVPCIAPTLVRSIKCNARPTAPRPPSPRSPLVASLMQLLKTPSAATRPVSLPSFTTSQAMEITSARLHPADSTDRNQTATTI